jgi:hypothetical protein
MLGLQGRPAQPAAASTCSWLRRLTAFGGTGSVCSLNFFTFLNESPMLSQVSLSSLSCIK